MKVATGGDATLENTLYACRKCVFQSRKAERVGFWAFLPLSPTYSTSLIDLSDTSRIIIKSGCSMPAPSGSRFSASEGQCEEYGGTLAPCDNYEDELLSNVDDDEDDGDYKHDDSVDDNTPLTRKNKRRRVLSITPDPVVPGGEGQSLDTPLDDAINDTYHRANSLGFSYIYKEGMELLQNVKEHDVWEVSDCLCRQYLSADHSESM